MNNGGETPLRRGASRAGPSPPSACSGRTPPSARVGGLIGFLLIFVIFAAAFFEARGSLFFLQFAHLRPPERQRGPVWLPVAGDAPRRHRPDHRGQLARRHRPTTISTIPPARQSTARPSPGAGALFFAGLFTLLGYWIDKELGDWVDRQGEEEMPEQFRNQTQEAPTATHRHHEHAF